MPLLPIRPRLPLDAALPALLAGVLAFGCSTGHRPATAAAPVPALPPAAQSGLLSDYSRLQPSDQFPSVLVYRDFGAKTGYRKIFFRPVEVWRSGSEPLPDVPEEDLQYLADSLYRAMVARLGQHFELVTAPGPHVLEIELGLTLVGQETKEEKKPVDTFSTVVPVRDLAPRHGPLSDGTRAFLQSCALEAEFSEISPAGRNAPAPAHAKAAASGPRPVASRRIVRAAFFDARRGAETPKGSVETWDDVDAVWSRWAGFLDDQLVALREGRFKPRLTVGAAAPRTAAPKTAAPAR